MILRTSLLAALTLLLPTWVHALECRSVTHNDARFTVCETDASTHDIRLFHSDPQGEVLGSFTAINSQLASEGLRLTMAMNAGMYHNDLSPVGLYIEKGEQAKSLVTREGPGNFGLLPNGVFCLRENRADVIETLRFEAEKPTCTYATQSGPMLVIDGALHPRFLPDSDSIHIRNGVGTSEDGKRVVFAISDERVNFHTFGALYRDVLKLPNALYFDGKVSRLHYPADGRSDFGFSLGPIVGVTEAVDD